MLTKTEPGMELFDTSNQALILQKISKLVEQKLLTSTLNYEFRGLKAENLRVMHQKQKSGSLIGKQLLIV